MVPGDATGEEISELPVEQITAERGVWQGEWRQNFQLSEDLYTACVKVRSTDSPVNIVDIGCFL